VKKHAYSTVFFAKEHYERSKALRAFEDRIARLTMVSHHADEAPAMFTRQIPGAAAGTFVQDQKLRNVHHDKNQRENRVVTVLVYLSTARDGDGGHTLFPCLPAAASGVRGVKLAKDLQRDFRRLFDNGTRVIDQSLDKFSSPDKLDLFGLFLAAYAFEKKSFCDTTLRACFETLLCKVACPALVRFSRMTCLLSCVCACNAERCNKQCRLAHKAEVLSVQPVKGTAIVFWNVQPDGQPNQYVWHSACQALGGPHRYALQKFKELPRISGHWVLEPDDKHARWIPGRALKEEL